MRERLPHSIWLAVLVAASLVMIGGGGTVWLVYLRDPWALSSGQRERLLAEAAAHVENINSDLRARLIGREDRWPEFANLMAAYVAHWDSVLVAHPLSEGFENELSSVSRDLDKGEIDAARIARLRPVMEAEPVEQLHAFLAGLEPVPPLAWLFDPRTPIGEQLVQPRRGVVPTQLGPVSGRLVGTMRIAAFEGRDVDARRAFVAGLRVGAISLSTGLAMDMLVGGAGYNRVVAEARRLLVEGLSPVRDPAAWLRAIDEGRPTWDFRAIAENEKRFARASTALTLVDMSDPEKRAALLEVNEEAAALNVVVYSSNKKADRWLPSGIDSAQLLADWPINERLAKAIGGPSNWLTMVARTAAQVDMEFDGLRVMLALEMHRVARGEYPETLTDLDLAPLGGALPHDRLSGRPYGYARLAGDRHGRGFILYSLGADATDIGWEKAAGLDRSTSGNSGGGIQVLNAPRAKRR